MNNIYHEIGERTGGNIYIGVVGPVRTGKSTLVKRFMESLVLPLITDPYVAERTRDELPQSGSGRTIMTSEPKFVPEEAVEICPDGTASVRVRMIDSVGYMVPGAAGAYEEDTPRMVTTPWFDHEIPMTQAAELGTKKVMQEHASIGLVVTTDGTITDIPRQDYEEAERKAIMDMKATGKPFLVIINSAKPNGAEAKKVQEHIYNTYQLDALVADCQSLDTQEITQILINLLYNFPMASLHVRFPRWLDALENEHPLKSTLYRSLLETAESIGSLSSSRQVLEQIRHGENISDAAITQIDLGSGIVHCELRFPEEMFYRILSEKAGMPIENDGKLLALLTELSQIKKEYDQISDALSCVNATGYGIVMPTAEQMQLQPPEVVRKGGAFGIKLKAGAPSIHMIRVDIDTEISPMVGGEQQSQELLDSLTGQDPDQLWQSNIFGKSVYTLIQEGLTTKLVRMPDDVRAKIRGSLTRIVNEGATGLICLIL